MAAIMRCRNICHRFCYMTATSSLEHIGWRRGRQKNTQKQAETFGRTNHINFFTGAYWIEERLTEEKRLNNTQKQAETFGRTQGLAHDWDKWSRLENSSSRLCPADF
ncbi:hypothetical protein PoB_002231500 [Plakobranchus ocellatus]|uniref:Uncharacterized protein n=1 Tax=Plakobranchus ocellatus TaxID=259542 RepID=A0AAV3ZJI5_9GAST|nr:hypothetical protein PoB_002231500 [Plakobranchus ocellatus]